MSGVIILFFAASIFCIMILIIISNNKTIKGIALLPIIALILYLMMVDLKSSAILAYSEMNTKNAYLLHKECIKIIDDNLSLKEYESAKTITSEYLSKIPLSKDKYYYINELVKKFTSPN
jgi:hypothetical protein